MAKYIVILLLIVIFLREKQRSSTVSIQSLNAIGEIYNKPTAIDTLLQMMAQEGIQFPIVALAQSILETGSYSSFIYDQNNNCFGMKHNSRGYSEGEKNGHASYKVPENSFRDYAAWQRKLVNSKNIASEEEYLRALDNLPSPPWKQGSRYAEDPQYTNKLRGIMKEIRRIRSAPSNGNHK